MNSGRDPIVFLSHSSKDRPFVEEVFAKLGPDRALIDQYAFDDGANLNEEIQEKIKSADVFCLFLSKNSIPSRWVKAEANLARALAESGGKLPLLFYIIDDTPVRDCPKWIVDKYLIRPERNPDLAAKRIRRALLERSAEGAGRPALFVNRRTEIGRIEDIRGLAPAEQPRAVFMHGWEGMGRDKLLVRAVGDESVARVTLRTASSAVDLYRELLVLLERPVPAELVAKESSFEKLDAKGQSAALGTLIDAVLRKRFHLEISENNSLFLENGALVPWFGEAVSAVPKSSPFCVFVRARRRPVNPHPRWGIDEIRVDALLTKDMENLLGQLLNEGGVDFTSEKTQRAANALGGHPLSALRFAGYAKRNGVDAALANDAIMVQYRELLLVDALDELELKESDWKVLYIVSRFRIVDLAGLSEYTMLPVQPLLRSLEGLAEVGMLSRNGNQYSISAFARDPLQRHRSWPLDKEWMATADERVARAVETFIDEGVGSSALLENGIAASLRQGIRSGPLANLVLGSHLFRVARELYDTRQYGRALDLYKEALDRRNTLAPEATSEALRFYGLCGARLGNEEILNAAITQLNGLNLSTALRNASFLRGFRDRRRTRYADALQHFEESLRRGEHPHTFREAAFCALKLDQIPLARRYATQAVAYAPTNAYFLDVMCRVVLAEFLGTRSRASEEEYEALFARLSRACRSTGDSFAKLRELECAVALRDMSRVRAAVPPLFSSPRYDDIICAAVSASLILDEDIGPLIQRLQRDAYSTPWKRRDFEALSCLQALLERRTDDAVRWIAQPNNESWNVESIGLGYHDIKRKVLARARASLTAGESLSEDTIRYLRQQR